MVAIPASAEIAPRTGAGISRSNLFALMRRVGIVHRDNLRVTPEMTRAEIAQLVVRYVTKQLSA
jgi:hypothetical protein